MSDHKLVSENVARLLAEGKLAEAGSAVGGEIQARIQANRKPTRPAFRDKGKRLPDDWILDPCNLWMGGYWRYMLDCEKRVIDEARARIAEERPRWRQRYMEMVELHLEHETNPKIVRGLKLELRKVQRALGLIKPTPETIREQTRERVRRHRERAKRAAKKKRPSPSAR